MPKRKHDQSKEDKWKTKLRKYEKKLDINARFVFWSEDDEWGVRNPSPFSRRSTIESPTFVNRLRHESTVAPPPPPSTMPDPVLSTDPVVSITSSDAVVPPILQLSEEPANEGRSVDPELISALGDFEDEQTEWGPDIIEALAKRWEPVLKQGLKNETKLSLLKKNLVPKNCAMLSESAKNRDSRLEKKQAQIGCALTILGKTMSDILTNSTDTSQTLSELSDVTKLLTDSHYLETETRRSLISPTLDKIFIEAFKDRKRDSYLFGDKLGDFIKSSRGIQKTGKMIQPTPTTSNNNLNSKGPPSRNYPHQRYPRNQAKGALGGQRRRRTNFQFPPPPPGSRPGRASPAARQKTAAATSSKRRQ